MGSLQVVPSKNWWALAMAAAVMLAIIGAVVDAKLRSTSPVKSVAQVQTESQTNGSGSQIAPRLANQKTAGMSPVVRTGHSTAQSARAATRRYARRSEEGTRTDSPTPPRQSNPGNSTEEFATNFLPLPYGSGLPLDEGWEMVRVSLPRSALESLGVPAIYDSATAERASANIVEADVVLGQDGLARAIRFVQ